MNIIHYLKKAIEDGEICNEVRRFLAEDLNECYITLKVLREDIYNISLSNKQFSNRKNLFSEKLLAFLYSAMVVFWKTDKVKGIPLSKSFIDNVRGLLSNMYQMHHSHITG